MYLTDKIVKYSVWHHTRKLLASKFAVTHGKEYSNKLNYFSVMFLEVLFTRSASDNINSSKSKNTACVLRGP